MVVKVNHCSERSQIIHLNSSEIKNNVVSVVRYFILIVVKVKQRSERSQRFPFNSSEVKQRSECSQ